MARFMWTVHVALPPEDAVQRCARCGFVLIDNTPWRDGRVAVEVTDPRPWPSYYGTGAMVGTDKINPEGGGMSYVIEDRGLDVDERMCECLCPVGGWDADCSVHGGHAPTVEVRDV